MGKGSCLQDLCLLPDPHRRRHFFPYPYRLPNLALFDLLDLLEAFFSPLQTLLYFTDYLQADTTGTAAPTKLYALCLVR